MSLFLDSICGEDSADESFVFSLSENQHFIPPTLLQDWAWLLSDFQQFALLRLTRSSFSFISQRPQKDHPKFRNSSKKQSVLLEQLPNYLVAKNVHRGCLLETPTSQETKIECHVCFSVQFCLSVYQFEQKNNSKSIAWIIHVTNILI